MKFGGNVFITKLLSHLSHKVCRLLSSPVLLRKPTISSLLLWSKNFVAMATGRHISPLYYQLFMYTEPVWIFLFYSGGYLTVKNILIGLIQAAAVADTLKVRRMLGIYQFKRGLSKRDDIQKILLFLKNRTVPTSIREGDIFISKGHLRLWVTIWNSLFLSFIFNGH